MASHFEYIVLNCMCGIRKNILRYIVGSLAIIVCCSVSVQALPDPLTRFLAKYMHFSRSELLAVQRGEVVAKPLDTNVKTELAVFGVVRVNAPASLLIETFRDIETFKKGEDVLKVTKLSNPPVREDFNGLTLEADDIKALKKCKPGKCDLKISAEMLKRMQSAITQGKSIDALYRDLLFEYVQSYLAQGNAALYKYNDEKKVVRLLDEFKGIVAASPYLKESLPDFYSYLDTEKRPPNTVESFIYWSKENLGFRPVISITQVSMYKSNATQAVIASKQIYANHYMNGSLGITVALSEQEDLTKPGFYMMYINRSRTDMLGGLLSGLKRSIAKSKSTTAVRQNVLMTKKRLEASNK